MAPRVWLITGCSSGFGHELTLQALKRGDKVIATSRNISGLTALKDAGAATLELDPSSSLATIKQFAEKAYATYGRIDVLVNNAGFATDGAVEETTEEETISIFTANVFAPLNIVRAFAPYLRAQKSGVIANISSIAGDAGSPGLALYCGTKSAISGISESMTHELAPFGIKVTCVVPGYFRSKFLNAGHRNSARNLIKEYDGTAAHEYMDMLSQVNNRQLGSVVKGSEAIIDVLTQSGRAAGRDIPIRFVLGDDAQGYVKEKFEERIALVKEWEGVGTGVSHDDVQ
ncbi:hypothetical protein AJ79_01879 [Helicocarpus griseus UAMH5409]|uniref:Uncharacterized protein n=1 Tax=Helicocarpus griseus UAMH5409 TaxID=1447875 RepID=A0A2B7Y6T4_9EURO|nr:hypothetical protein AJ79_01879 [Helicocarpus griseus UAMH5409]